MEINDLISIILPVYNGEKYLKESIDSIRNQTYPNWELLILDDCSSDATAIISADYVRMDSRIKYFRNSENLRLPRNLNKGFSLTRGDYLTWTSDDNRYRPKALETMLKALKESKTAQFAFASCRIIDEEGQEIDYMMVDKNSTRGIVGGNPVGACFLYTRNVYERIGDYDPEFTLVEDFDYWQRILVQFDAVPIPEILYDYRRHVGALTSTMRKDVFNRTLEKLLLKNRPSFGKLSTLQNYYFYRGLYTCRKNLREKKNPYAPVYHLYATYYFIFYRVPDKLKRMIRWGG